MDVVELESKPSRRCDRSSVFHETQQAPHEYQNNSVYQIFSPPHSRPKRMGTIAALLELIVVCETTSKIPKHQLLLEVV